MYATDLNTIPSDYSLYIYVLVLIALSVVYLGCLALICLNAPAKLRQTVMSIAVYCFMFVQGIFMTSFTLISLKQVTDTWTLLFPVVVMCVAVKYAKKHFDKLKCIQNEIRRNVLAVPRSVKYQLLASKHAHIKSHYKR